MSGANVIYHKLQEHNAKDVFMFLVVYHAINLQILMEILIITLIVMNKIVVMQQQDMLNHQVKLV